MLRDHPDPVPCLQGLERESPILSDRIALLGKIAGNESIASVNLALSSRVRVSVMLRDHPDPVPSPAFEDSASGPV